MSIFETIVITLTVVTLTVVTLTVVTVTLTDTVHSKYNYYNLFLDQNKDGN